MAYDEKLAQRIRGNLPRSGVTEKQMFGGLAFLLNAKMCCGVHANEMIARTSPQGAQAALRERDVRVFDLSGRPMKGWLLVAARGLTSDTALQRWTPEAVAFARALARKERASG
jgi:hypothetical protein